ncbi:leucine--tRNA ligase [Candidatus Peregrinibacteria bacterium]|nr:leucine--tRNA ligase [Candidatus Peregrinibacteria bacterium]
MAQIPNYDHINVEKKWQKNWEDRGAFEVDNAPSEKTTYYILDMFPYPSGAGLHVGHPEGYTATDIVSRYMRMKDYEVLHPMGWDAFGLPAENYAIKTNVAPEKSTRGNIENFTGQIKSLGFSYDWTREIATCDPSYYRWTQWIFSLLYKNGLAYKKEAPVNWCDGCMTVLANEQVVDGACERCKNDVLQKNLSQWFFKITDFIEDYVDEKTGRTTTGLINGLDKIDWPESTKIAQRNWIGKSFGTEVDFEIEGSNQGITVYTTRVDTLFSGTFIVIAPEHPLVEKLTLEEHREEVRKYMENTQGKSEIQRTDLNKDKTGAFTGSYAINPVTNDRMPIWVADFVLVNYGTGIVFADAHDERDFEMAKKFNIPLKVSLRPKDDELWKQVENLEVCFHEEGILVNSEEFDGLISAEAREGITDRLIKEGKGRRTTNYRLRDWLISRQRYWGSPIPVVYDSNGNASIVKDDHLPLELPTDVDYKPKGTSPLGSSEEYVARAEELYGEGARFEIDTMDTFVCSSWYFWRFMDPKNEKLFAGSEALKKWGAVDLYVGGAEHTVMHLLYARFFCKVLHRFGYIDYDEPFLKLRHQGMILGEDGEKMSKSRGNVINPNEIVERHGADTLRMYEMFMGPFKDMKPWNMNGAAGIYRFVQKVWKLYSSVKGNGFATDDACENLRHKTIKKITEDTENFKFNTAISQMMVYVNELNANGATKKDMEALLLILGIYSPHISAEIWELLGFEKELGFLDEQPWPIYDAALCVDNEIEFAVQVNGKLRGTFMSAPNITKDEALKEARELENVSKFLNEGEVLKEIYVPGKLVNFVVR